jgi:hypothetical protein
MDQKMQENKKEELINKIKMNEEQPDLKEDKRKYNGGVRAGAGRKKTTSLLEIRKLGINMPVLIYNEMLLFTRSFTHFIIDAVNEKIQREKIKIIKEQEEIAKWDEICEAAKKVVAEKIKQEKRQKTKRKKTTRKIKTREN